MVEDTSSYLVRKLHQKQPEFSFKAKQTLHGFLINTPKLIKAAFIQSSAGKKPKQTNNDNDIRYSTLQSGVTGMAATARTVTGATAAAVTTTSAGTVAAIPNAKK